MVYRCRYCGSYALNPDTGNDGHYDEDPVYKCSHCGIKCTQNEARMFARPAQNGSREQKAIRAETVKNIADLDSSDRISLIPARHEDLDSADRIPLITVKSADFDSALAISLNDSYRLSSSHAVSLNKSAGPFGVGDISLSKSAGPFGAGNVSLNKSAGPGRAAADSLNEYERLTDAWTAMKNEEWSAAIHLLNQAQPPLTYPLEYLILGNICRGAPLCQAPQDLLHLRCQQLLILINNIDGINFYLSEDEDWDFAALEHIYAALLLLGRQPVKKHKTAIGDQTNYLRANAISAFAACLKDRAQATVKVKYHTAYLKMAVRLLYQCLEFSKEKQVLFVALKDKELNLPTEYRLRINAEIKQLNAAIRLHDANFIPVRPPHVPIAQLISSINLSFNEVMFIGGLLFYLIVSFGLGILLILGGLPVLVWIILFSNLLTIGVPIYYHIQNGTIIKSFDDYNS
ncbi:MAG: hypothetical protein Q4F00_03350 [bacterium]|nr:hypothetical protein [bacterium]